MDGARRTGAVARRAALAAAPAPFAARRPRRRPSCRSSRGGGRAVLAAVVGRVEAGPLEVDGHRMQHLAHRTAQRSQTSTGSSATSGRPRRGAAVAAAVLVDGHGASPDLNDRVFQSSTAQASRSVARAATRANGGIWPATIVTGSQPRMVRQDGQLRSRTSWPSGAAWSRIRRARGRSCRRRARPVRRSSRRGSRRCPSVCAGVAPT